MKWVSVLNDRMNELEIIATWASLTNLGRVRDACRLAICELKQEKERWEECFNAGKNRNQEQAK